MNFYLVRIFIVAVILVPLLLIPAAAFGQDEPGACVEMGALAISTRFRNQRVGVHTVKSFMALMNAQGYNRFISLTNTPRLEALYRQLGFVQESRPEYGRRQEQSPDVKMFCKIDEPAV